jgi:hypothetical protein
MDLPFGPGVLRHASILARLQVWAGSSRRNPLTALDA